MKARTLNIGEIVCVDVDNTYLGLGEIVSIDGERMDFYFSGDELNVDVEVRITEVNTEVIIDGKEIKVGETYHFDNRFIYQVAGAAFFETEIVCYEHDNEIDFDYFAPVQGISINESDLDGADAPVNGYEYVQEQIESGRWDLDSDTFDIKQALADAFDEGFAKGKES